MSTLLGIGDAPPQRDSLTERERDGSESGHTRLSPRSSGTTLRCSLRCSPAKRSCSTRGCQPVSHRERSSVRTPAALPIATIAATSMFGVRWAPASSPLRTLPTRPSFSPELRFELRYIHNLQSTQSVRSASIPRRNNQGRRSCTRPSDALTAEGPAESAVPICTCPKGQLVLPAPDGPNTVGWRQQSPLPVGIARNLRRIEGTSP